MVGLRSNGTCVANSITWNTGYGYDGQSDVSGWQDIVAIACGRSFTMGLKRDGTVVYTGEDVAKSAAGWTNIAMIAAGGRGAVGITREGKVVSAGQVSIDAMERAENIIQLGVAGGTAYALQADGVLVGGRADSYNPNEKREVTKNVVAMNTGAGVIVLKQDGTLQRCGRSLCSAEIPSGYRLFDSYDDWMQERIAAEKARKERDPRHRDSDPARSNLRWYRSRRHRRRNDRLRW